MYNVCRFTYKVYIQYMYSKIGCYIQYYYVGTTEVQQKSGKPAQYESIGESDIVLIFIMVIGY